MSEMTLPDAVLHDRKDRKNMSRRVYAETVGITENRVHALEHGRKIKPEEVAALQPFIGDLTNLGAEPTVSPSALPPRQPREEIEPVVVAQPVTQDVDWEAERAKLARNYVHVMELLGDRVPPFPWPSQFRLETLPPVEFIKVQEWITNVAGWLAQVDGTTEPLPSEEPPSTGESEPETVTYSDWTDEDWDEPVPDTTVPDPQPGPLAQMPGQVAERADQIFESAQLSFVQEPDKWYVTNGELQTFKDCERRWYLSTYLQVGTGREKLVGSAAVGTRFHASLATWYRPEPGDPWDTFNAGVHRDREILVGQDASEEVMKQFESEVDLVRAMLEGYFQWVEETSADVGLRITAAERAVTVDPKIPGHENVRLLAKLDAEFEHEMDDSRGFIDHKTGSNFNDMIRKLQMDEQMQHYNLIKYLQIVEEGQMETIRVAGAIYNMARRVKRTATAEPPFYGREPVQFNIEQIRSYWLRVKGTMDKILAVRQALANGADHREVAPPRPSNECHWKCEFFALCPMMDHSPKGAQDYISEVLVQVNPLRRYEPDVTGVTM